MLTKSAHLFHF